MGEIDRLAALQGAEINEAKKVLADQATTLLHGADAAAAARATAEQTFEAGVTAASLPSIEIAESEVAAGLGVLNAFVKAGLVASNGEARRQVQSGGIRVNDATVTDPQQVLTPADLHDGAIKLSFGKKKHVLLRAI